MIFQSYNCTAYTTSVTDNFISEEKFKKWTPANGWMISPFGVRYFTYDKTCLYASPGKEAKQ